jgi:AraC family ethanolamine operon transcriptional activator
MNNYQFTQFEDYAQAVIHADLQLKLPRLFQPQWELKTASLGQIDIQFGKEGSGIIADGSAQKTGYTIFVPISGLQFANGEPLEDRRILVMTPGGVLAIASRVPHDWCSIVIPFELLSHDQQERLDSPTKLGTSHVQEIGPQATKRLRQLLLEFEHALKTKPQVQASAAAKVSMQNELLVACKPLFEETKPNQRTRGRPTIDRRAVLERVLEKIESPLGCDGSMNSLIDQAGVSERTLRSIFLEYYGLPPHRYMMVYRLHQARTVLLRESLTNTTVSNIAAQFGFWHFGRFAREYRKLFGESPSQTIKKTRSA